MNDVPASSVTPSVEDVARIIRARTKDAQMDEVGTFTDNTRPTDAQVEEAIAVCEALVMSRFATAPAELVAAKWFTGAARGLVAYRTALQVEKSYFPEQVRSDRSAYDQLRQEYLDDLAALEKVVDDVTGGGPADDWDRRLDSVFTPTFLHMQYARLLAAWDPWLDGPWGDVPPDGPWPEPENPENWAQPLQPPRVPPHPEDLPVGEEPARRAIPIRGPRRG